MWSGWGKSEKRPRTGPTPGREGAGASAKRDNYSTGVLIDEFRGPESHRTDENEIGEMPPARDRSDPVESFFDIH